jgi:MipA family protein
VVWRRVAANHHGQTTKVNEATMRRLYRAGAAALLTVTLGTAKAQSSVSTQATTPPPGESVSAPAKAAPKFEGAVGLVLAHKPAFSGSSDRQLTPQLAGFVRYGRFTLTGAGGFTTRRQDDVERGLDAELLRREGVRINLSLRYDQGRRESESDQLAGMGNIKHTVRSRLGLRWEPAPYWSLSLASGLDLLGAGGGYTVEAGVSRTFLIDAQQRVILGAGVTGAGDRYLQTWYGVTAEQSARSGYPVYKPGEGLRDVHTNATWRVEVNPQWAGFASFGASRLLGSAADSPLTLQRNGWSMSAGIARRF